MKTFKIVILVTTEDTVKAEDITLMDCDIMDGFYLTREHDSDYDEELNSAYIESCEESNI